MEILTHHHPITWTWAKIWTHTHKYTTHQNTPQTPLITDTLPVPPTHHVIVANRLGVKYPYSIKWTELSDWLSWRPLGIAELAASQRLISCRPESLQPLPLQMHFLTMYKIFINGQECISKGSAKEKERENDRDGWSEGKDSIKYDWALIEEGKKKESFQNALLRTSLRQCRPAVSVCSLSHKQIKRKQMKKWEDRIKDKTWWMRTRESTSSQLGVG